MTIPTNLYEPAITFMLLADIKPKHILKSGRLADEAIVEYLKKYMSVEALEVELGRSLPEELKHLPGRHDQKTHAGDQVPSGWTQDNLYRNDEQKHWEAIGLRQPSDDELMDAYALDLGPSYYVLINTDVYKYGEEVKGVELKGVVKDTYGNERGHFLRSFLVDSATGEATVTHDGFVLDESIRHQGIGMDMFLRSEELYKRLGVKQISTIADSTVGTYAWARAGFDYSTERGRANALSGFSIYMDEKGIPISERPNLTRPWEIAAWKNPLGSGKDFLLNHAKIWNGVKRLEPNWIGNFAAEAYLLAKKRL